MIVWCDNNVIFVTSVKTYSIVSINLSLTNIYKRKYASRHQWVVLFITQKQDKKIHGAYSILIPIHNIILNDIKKCNIVCRT